jgi:hypothetical protein
MALRDCCWSCSFGGGSFLTSEAATDCCDIWTPIIWAVCPATPAA